MVEETPPSKRLSLPVLALRQLVIFPGVTLPIAAGRPQTLRAVEAASKADNMIFTVLQREDQADVDPNNLHTIGTVARIDQLQRGLAGTQMLVSGTRRGIALRVVEENGFLRATVAEAEELMPPDAADIAFVALDREVRTRAGELGQKTGLSADVAEKVLNSVEHSGALADLVAGFLDISPHERQSILESLSVEDRLRKVLMHLQRQISVLDAQAEIKEQVQEELGDRQREMYLREQLKAIQKELGEGDDSNEVAELREKIDKLELPEDVGKEVDRELSRLERMGREAMEAQVIRTYIETIAELPWNKKSPDDLELARAGQILDEDHYGLGEVKDRILEFLAVRQLQQRGKNGQTPATESPEADSANQDPANQESAKQDSANQDSANQRSGDQGSEDQDSADEASPDEASADEASADEASGDQGSGDPVSVDKTAPNKPESRKSPILLFAGPPGVGKTSLAKSIARAMGREYVRIALGGVRDEADIRGHRRTYVAAMPGRIIQGMKRAGTKNPVFLLDEVDKLGASLHGDPSAALLEVLDPAQNNSFTDHYLGLPFDLSDVFFVATANFLQNIPEPLLDRMETVEFSGYTQREKLEIAKAYLVPRQIHDGGLTTDEIKISDEAITRVIDGHTREAGVRQLERELGRLVRKVARQIAESNSSTELPVCLERGDIRELLGRPKVHPEEAAGVDQVGVATGLFYTPVGGDILFVEASTMPGKGNLVLTGKLGDVMQESARAALTYARSHSDGLRIDPERFTSNDVHIHVPAGAIPKEGPSAGITMATALISALSGRPVRHDIAMTGEITLNGKVLPIGGVKEKVLGAVRAGIHTIILPEKNEPDLEDLPEDVRKAITVHTASELGEVLAVALRGASYEDGRLLFVGDEPSKVSPLTSHDAA